MTAGPCHFCDQETDERFGGMWLCPDCRPGDEADSGDESPASAARETTTDETGDDTADAPSVDDSPLADGRAVVADERRHPDGITDRDWWVAWILDGVGRKRPVAPWQTGHAFPVEWSGDLEGDERPETDYATASRWADFGLDELGVSLPDDAQSDGLELGIILPNDRPARDVRVMLIDWDDVRDPDTGEIHPVALDYIRRFGGYVEVSTSGEGLHQFVRGGLRHRGKFIAPIDDKPFVGDDLPQVEMYDGGRHVAMTGRHVVGTGTDLVDAQEMIDEVVTEYADAEQDAGHRRYDPETGEDGGPTDEGDGADGEVPEPERGEYGGPALDQLRETKPDDRPLAYHAVVEAFFRGGGNAQGYANVLNWRLEGMAAALGDRAGLSADEVIADLGGAYLDETGVEQGCRHETPHRVEYAHDRAGTDRFAAPSRETLVDYGVLPPEADTDTKPAVATPLARFDALDHDEARRYARKREEWPTTREARQKLRDRIVETIRHGDQKVIDAPTALGKSHTVATEPWLDRADTTGEAPVVMFHETREARDQAVEASREANVRAARLLGRSEACACAAGEHDPARDEGESPDVVVTVDGEPASEWLRRVCDQRGLPLSVAHRMLAERCDQDHDQLPCEGPVDLGDDQDGGRCQSVAQWDDVPRDGEGDVRHDVIHATHQFAHVPSLRNGTNMVFDERPDFAESLSHDRVRGMVAAYLDDAGAPVTDFERFVARARRDREERSPNEHAEHGYVSDALDHEPDREWYVDAPDAHTLAPAVTRAIWYALDDAEADRNGRFRSTVPHDPPRLDEDASDEAGWNREYLSVVLDDQHDVRTLRVAPDTGNVRSVVGLDAHPTLHLWQRNVHPDIRPRPVLDPTERARWRRYERGLVVAQVGDATRPLTSGEYFDEGGTRAFLDALRDQFGERWSTAITAASVEGRTADLMEEVGVDDPETLHYGEEKSRNDFGAEDVGAVLGCIDPGDDYVLDLLAEAGLDAEPETTESGDRAHGRGFVGPDADAAAALLASVRENHVAQAAGRYARNADDQEDRAVVFVRTDATPPGFVDVEVPGVEYVGTDDQRAIVDALRERPTATAGEVAEAADVTERYVRDVLARLADAGTVKVREGAGDHGANVYRALAGLDGPEQVDLAPETRNGDVWGHYTFAFRIAPADPTRPARESGSSGPEAGGSAPTADARGADPPE